MTIIKTSARPN